MKVFLLLCFFGLAQQLSAQVTLVAQYKVGDTVCGGILFYVVNDNNKHTQTGLVCAAADVGAADYPWYNGNYDTTAATVDSLFDLWNANKVISKEGRSGQYAALLANGYYVSITNKNCYLDSTWYLPSRIELDTLWATLGSKGQGNFVNEGYWSSVEGGVQGDTAANNIPRNAWIVDFYNGHPLLVDKANIYRVRPIREVVLPYINANAAKAKVIHKGTM